MWVLTVFSDKTSCSAMTFLLRPWASRGRISRSRLVMRVSAARSSQASAISGWVVGEAHVGGVVVGVDVGEAPEATPGVYTRLRREELAGIGHIRLRGELSGLDDPPTLIGHIIYQVDIPILACGFAFVALGGNLFVGFVLCLAGYYAALIPTSRRVAAN